MFKKPTQMSSPNNPIYVHDSDSESDVSEPEAAPVNFDDVSDDDAPVADVADDVPVPDDEKDEDVLLEEHQVRFALYKRILFHDVDNNEDVEYEDDAICSSIPGRRPRESWDAYIDRVGQFVVSDELLQELPDVGDRVRAVRDRRDSSTFVERCCNRVRVLHDRLTLRAQQSSSSDDDDAVVQPDTKRPRLAPK